MDVRSMVNELREACVVLLDRPELPPEAAYRIRKIMDRVAPVVDRVYLKTLKGGETLLQCTEKARAVGDHLHASDDYLYRLLTDLEVTCEDLLRTAYEFRIKAG